MNKSQIFYFFLLSTVLFACREQTDGPLGSIVIRFFNHEQNVITPCDPCTEDKTTNCNDSIPGVPDLGHATLNQETIWTVKQGSYGICYNSTDKTDPNNPIFKEVTFTAEKGDKGDTVFYFAGIDTSQTQGRGNTKVYWIHLGPLSITVEERLDKKP